MSDTYYVVPQSLVDAENSLKKNLEDFKQATEDAGRAAIWLGLMWSGDSKDAFQEEQRECQKLYQQMQQLVAQMITMINTAGNRYASTDHSCAKLLRIE